MTMTLPFGDDLGPPRPEQAERLAPRLRALAERGAYFGTSSWKYPGWLGSIYTDDRYSTRGKFSQKRFEAECVSEYAEIFPTVCGDFAFYQFPGPPYWRKLFEATPEAFCFAFKVPEEITVPRWPKLRRHGSRAGQPNEGFLNVELFRRLFAKRLEPYRERVAVLIFEFGAIPKSIFDGPNAFSERLSRFLEVLPKGFRYAVEVRNREYLSQPYFRTLAAQNAAHVFNAWTRMPEIGDQIAIPEAWTADFTVARALLKRGRGYEEAVRALEPYERIQEPIEEVRTALVRLADGSMRRRIPTFLYVNNRLEGHAPSTIEAVAQRLEES